MASKAHILRFDHLTYRGNSRDTRYGWLRLTPAFSVHFVQQFIKGLPNHARVLDPFCGTGTTALVCAEEGVPCTTTDINAFLLWLADAKCAAYSHEDIENARHAAKAAVQTSTLDRVETWIPPLHQIDKWWEPSVLALLGKLRASIKRESGHVSDKAAALLDICFCRTMIDLAKVSFSHQSMSFKKPAATLLLDLPMDPSGLVLAKWKQITHSILNAAQTEIATQPQFIFCDARNLESKLPLASIDCVVTSPPYPNRMSYIRELRPYMYWLGYLTNGRDAGEMDWQAIGGTWGCATSNLAKWEPPKDRKQPSDDFASMLSRIAASSPLLSRYVHKYFCDMALHIESVSRIVKSGGTFHYIIGNSKFYDVLVPVQDIFASLFSVAGLCETRIETIRKRTSKKELYEYVVSARKP